MKKIISLSIGLLFFSSFNSLAHADDATELQKLKTELKSLGDSVSKLNALIEKQQKTIDQLESKAQVSSTPQITPTTSNKAISTFVPEIGVVADGVASFTESSEDEEGNDRLSIRELEVVFGHDVDPYSRLDATVSFSELEDAALEEAYLSHWGLPLGFKVKLGRFFPRVGIASSMHRDSLDTVDEPFVVQQLFGEEAYSRSGLELSNFLPIFADGLTQEAAFGVLEGGVGDGGTLFGDSERSPTIYARLKNSVDISESTLLNLGTTFLAGSSDKDSSFETKVLGIDLLLDHHFNPINKIKSQTEIYLQDRDTGFLGTAEEMSSPEFRDHPLGMYSLLDYRLSQSWGIGFRFDYVEPINITEELKRNNETAYSVYVSFYQSEFARFRAQYQHARLVDGDDDRFLLQMTAAIGTHKHNIQ